MAGNEIKQTDGVADGPENGGLKSGPCLIAGFHALSCTSPSYYNPYRDGNKNTLSVDMVRLSLSFKGDRGEIWGDSEGAAERVDVGGRFPRLPNESKVLDGR